jgi:hypothetical protein
MEIDYTKGRYKVIGPNNEAIGLIDNDEYVRNGLNLIYRIDGLEVYPATGSNVKVLALIDSGAAITASGQKLFTIHPE